MKLEKLGPVGSERFSVRERAAHGTQRKRYTFLTEQDLQ
jgi:hypothetical protein